MKKLVSLFLLLPFFTLFSCDKGDENLTENPLSENVVEHEFDYSLYNNRELLFTTLKRTEDKKVDVKSSGTSDLENSIEIINAQFGTDLTITEVDRYLIDHPAATIDDFLKNGFLNAEEYEVIDSFFTDLNTFDFNQSVERLQTKILSMNLNSDEFEKYNFFVNSLMVTNEYYLNQGINLFSESERNNLKAEISAACAVSIAGNAVSTYGLTSCIVPGPNCWAAIAGKTLSLAGMYLSC